MSDGYFNYIEYRIKDTIDLLREFVDPENPQMLSLETIQEFNNALDYLKKSAIYIERIDGLVSGDDLEKTFHKRLKEDLLEKGL